MNLEHLRPTEDIAAENERLARELFSLGPAFRCRRPTAVPPRVPRLDRRLGPRTTPEGRRARKQARNARWYGKNREKILDQKAAEYAARQA